MKPCNNPACACTTSIADTLEHGWGELSDYGFWEFPCEICNQFYNNNIIVDNNIVVSLAKYLDQNYVLIGGSYGAMYYLYKRECKYGPSDYRVVEWRNGGLKIKKICNY